MVPQWLRRESAVFGGMVLESIKFILVSILVFTSVFLIINGPAVWDNVKWWWYVNYIDDHSGRWWGIDFPLITDRAEPDNTLMIPKIGVQAPIVFSETNSQSEITNLLQTGVVHYPQTAFPGEKGNVFITGHSSYYWWSKGAYNNIFSILDKLVIGDTIYINYGYKRYTYKVYEQKVVMPNEVSVLDQGSTYDLSLMTCTPVGTNYKRLIIKANQVDPPPPDTAPAKSKK